MFGNQLFSKYAASFNSHSNTTFDSNSGEVHANFSAQLARIQATAERQHYAMRVNMLRRDITRDSLLRSVR